MRSDSPRVAAASEARRSSGLSTSSKRVSLEAETAYDSHHSSSITTPGKRASLEAEMAYEAHRSGSLSASGKQISLEAETAYDTHCSSSLTTSGKRVSLEAETAYDSPTLLPLQSLVFPSNRLSQQDVGKREQKDESSRFYNNIPGGFYS